MEDLRIVKTKKALHLTLIKLMKEKSFEDIKISDICNEALINRSTFYAHYDDKYELLIDLVDTLKNDLFDNLNKNKNIVNTKEFYIELIRLILDHIDEQKEIYYSILMSNRNSIITDIILDVTIKDINDRIEIDNITSSDIPTDIIVKFYLGAVVGVCIGWLKNSNKYTKQDIINYLTELIPNNIVK